jgi:putative FmdB family regulatory protein
MSVLADAANVPDKRSPNATAATLTAFFIPPSNGSICLRYLALIRAYRLTSLDYATTPNGEERSHLMPTYQYACSACGHAFELFQSFSDNAITECPECKGLVKKVFSNVGVVFKGSGFYKTDSAPKPASAD